MRLKFFSKKFDIYTDGSHKGKWGSWAFVIVYKNKIIYEACGRQRKTNSLRMEFQAAIEALSYLAPGSTACVHSDSKILVDSALKLMLQPDAHQDQIEKINHLSSLNQITWKWVKAHTGIEFNERCDQLCLTARS